MSSVAKTITVLGGNGFLGKRICQAAVSNGFNVTSLSRSGAPPVSVSYQDHDWVSKVSWQKANVFDPTTYAKQLQKTDVVVHSMGILLESDYKSKLNAQSSQQPDIAQIIDDLKNIVSPNPMAKNPSLSYEQMNKQSAIIAATNFIKATSNSKKKVKPNLKFVYISADKGFPIIPSGYITSKREAERGLIDLANINSNFSTLIARPGFMFDEQIQGDMRSAFSSLLGVADAVNSKVLQGLLSGLIRPAISTQQVASKIIKSVQEDRNGILLLEQLFN